MKIGTEVRAAVKITEPDFVKRGRVHVHAHPGDTGVVCLVRGTLILVRWGRTGTACDVDVSDVHQPDGV